jgi:hypothetical protein
MPKPGRKPNMGNRLRELLQNLGRLLNPPKAVPVRVPVRPNKPRI